MRCIRGSRGRSSSSLAEFKVAVRYAMSDYRMHS